MRWLSTLALLPLALVVVLSIGVALLVLRRRTAPGARVLAVNLLAYAWWAALYALELAAADLPAKLLMAQLKFAALVAIPALWLVFALHVIGQAHWLTARRVAALLLVPAITLGLAATLPWHGLIYRSYAIGMSGPIRLLEVTYGPWFWVHSAYGCALLLVAAALVAGELVRPAALPRRQATAALLCAVVPSVAAVARVFRLGPWPGLDLAPFACLVTCGVLLWALCGRQFLSIVPIAREAIVDGLGDAVLILDARGRVVDLNRAARYLLGEAGEAALGRPIDAVLPLPSGALIAHGAGSAPVTMALDAGGTPRSYDLTIAPLSARGQLLGRAILLRDVTDRERAAAQLAHLARHDVLTGALNRGGFLAELERALATTGDAGHRVALLFLDLDGFKGVNDTHGHAMGDQLLRAAAERIRRCLGPHDMIGRLGGDEFTVLVAEPLQVAQRSLRIADAFAQPFSIAGRSMRLSASIGTAIAPDDGMSASALLRAADAAMYAAKAVRKRAGRTPTGPLLPSITALD
jgi:diguanylate cyclase (GGDEF)-like protein